MSIVGKFPAPPFNIELNQWDNTFYKNIEMEKGGIFFNARVQGQTVDVLSWKFSAPPFSVGFVNSIHGTTSSTTTLKWEEGGTFLNT